MKSEIKKQLELCENHIRYATDFPIRDDGGLSDLTQAVIHLEKARELVIKEVYGGIK
jgi:hypothetical protein